MGSIFSPVNSIWDFLLRLYIVISAYAASLLFIFLISKVRTELKLIFSSHEKFKKYYNSPNIPEKDHKTYQQYNNNPIKFKKRAIGGIVLILGLTILPVLGGILWPFTLNLKPAKRLFNPTAPKTTMDLTQLKILAPLLILIIIFTIIVLIKSTH